MSSLSSLVTVRDNQKSPRYGVKPSPDFSNQAETARTTQAQAASAIGPCRDLTSVRMRKNVSLLNLKHLFRRATHVMFMFRKWPLKTQAAFAAICLSITACDQNNQQVKRDREPARVIAEPVQINNERTKIEVVGTSRALQSVTLHPPSSGEIVRINFKPDQHVEAGHLLVELDQRKERLAVELATFRLSEAERLFERYRKSAETGATLPTTLDAARTELEAARIGLGQSRIALEDRNIIAPFSGHVGITQYDPGDRVQVDTAVTTLDNRDAMLVTFELPELMIEHVHQGSEVVLQTWEQLSKTFTGKVVDIDSRIDPDLRTFIARAVVENNGDRLRPGMSFKVRFEIPGEPYPIIPEIAVQWGADGAYVWKVVEGHAERVSVEIVQREKGYVMVNGGSALKEHDITITEGIQRLRPGLPVKTQTAVARDAAEKTTEEASRG